jgi:hypothetical protein
MGTSELEGWCTDPFGLHEARWLSDGVPTKLVRDDGVESYEDPPGEEWTVTPSPIIEEPRDTGREAEDLRRKMSEAAEFGSTWGSHMPMPGQHDSS